MGYLPKQMTLGGRQIYTNLSLGWTLQFLNVYISDTPYAPAYDFSNMTLAQFMQDAEMGTLMKVPMANVTAIRENDTTIKTSSHVFSNNALTSAFYMRNMAVTASTIQGGSATQETLISVVQDDGTPDILPDMSDPKLTGYTFYYHVNSTLDGVTIVVASDDAFATKAYVDTTPVTLTVPILATNWSGRTYNISVSPPYNTFIYPGTTQFIRIPDGIDPLITTELRKMWGRARIRVIESAQSYNLVQIYSDGVIPTTDFNVEIKLFKGTQP